MAIRPISPYKINVEYPFKMTILAPPGSKMDKSAFATADAREFSKQRIRLEPTFSLDRPGMHRFDGEMRFSVCTAQLCELKTAKIRWTARTR